MHWILRWIAENSFGMSQPVWMERGKEEMYVYNDQVSKTMDGDRGQTLSSICYYCIAFNIGRTKSVLSRFNSRCNQFVFYYRMGRIVVTLARTRGTMTRNLQCKSTAVLKPTWTGISQTHSSQVIVVGTFVFSPHPYFIHRLLYSFVVLSVTTQQNNKNDFFHLINIFKQ